MPAMKTPGVYIVEKNAFPNSVVEVATAVPAFIGYTAKALNGTKTLINQPWRITSMAEFRSYFGEASKPQFSVTADDNVPGITFDGTTYAVTRADSYNLFYQMLLFYANGGGPCYIVSVGDYTAAIGKEALAGGIDTLLKEQEPTLLVIPEAMYLTEAADCYALQQEMLSHCGYKMRNRFALLDIYGGYKDRNHPDGDVVAGFRENTGSEFLDYAAAYYPWINTSIVQETELSFLNITDAGSLKDLLLRETELLDMPDAKKTARRIYQPARHRIRSYSDGDTPQNARPGQSPLPGDHERDAADYQPDARIGRHGRNLHTRRQYPWCMESTG